MTAVEAEHAFWADEIADRIEARASDEPIVIKGGISPSGVPHLGNANEIVLGYFVAEVLRERGHTVRQVFTSDDRDPLRSLPRKLADLGGNLVEFGEVDAAALGRNLGNPYAAIPDPFGCCASYGDHFTELITDIAEELAIPVEVISTTELYEGGEFDDAIRMLLEHREAAAEVLARHQSKIDEDYVPFKPHCAACGKETETVLDVNPDAGAIAYRCTDIEAGNRTIGGCGHEGETDPRGGKLPWRFEWVAQWAALGVDFEPFGKDHAEGSWPSGVDIAEELFEIDPPVPMTYEWFTFEGEPFSSSEGHVIMVSEVLELIEAPVLLSFFARDPTRGRDFSIERIDQLADRFDRLEAIALGRIKASTAERAYAERVYPILVHEVRPERFRLPYRFAAVLGMTDDEGLRETIARREGHIPADAPRWAVEEALARVERARRWARRTDNEYNYELQRAERPSVELDEGTAAALEDLADVVAAGTDGDRLQEGIFEAARDHGLEPATLFQAGYRLFLDREEGPKLGPFLASLDQSFVEGRLRRER